MGYWLLETLGLSLVLTIMIEEFFAFLIGIRDKKDLSLLFYVNILTNPMIVLVYYICFYYTEWNLTIVTVLLELIAIFIESYYFRVYGKYIHKPLLFAVVINVISFGVGKIISTFI